MSSPTQNEHSNTTSQGNEEESSSDANAPVANLAVSTNTDDQDGDHHGDHHDHDDDHAATCPICFQHEELAVAPCQHVLCIPCAERVLLSASTSSQSPSRQMDEFVSPEYPAGREQDIDELKIPGWNTCPMCRKSLILWDLRRHVSVATDGGGGSSSSNGVQGDQKSVPDESSLEVDKEHKLKADATVDSSMGCYVYSREPPDFATIPFLAGSVWLESADGSTGRVGYGSFHFPPHADDPEMTKAYYDLDQVSGKRLLLEDCLYHKGSRLLSARLVNEDEMGVDDNDSSYRLILAFSADGSFVRSGAMVVEQPTLTPSRHIAKFPFDGFWDFQDERITVVGHKCILNGQPVLLKKAFEVDEDYSESLGDEDCDRFPVDLLKLMTTTGRVLGTTDCTRGIGVGSQLVWNLKGSRSAIGCRRKWKWLRMAGPSAVTDRIPRSKVHRWGGPHAHRWLKRQGPRFCENGGSTTTHAPTYHSESVWGNVFCQGLKVGLASYHFEPPADDEEIGRVYISYENPDTSAWPPLDNGQPIPAKVYFHNVSFPTPTTFRGQILWQEDFGTPWQGMIRWEYEMKFDAQFTCIVGGQVSSYEVHAPDTGRELSRYGEALVYCNAALYNEFRRQVTSEEDTVATTDDSNEGRNHRIQDWADRFRVASLELRFRLQGEGASVRTIAMVHRLMTIAYQGESETSPIDYNIPAEPTMDLDGSGTQ